MGQIVGVHGIGQQLLGPKQLHDSWSSALVDGVAAAGEKIESGALTVAFYGDIYRAAGRRRAAGNASYRVDDVQSDEASLLVKWWECASELERLRVPAPDLTMRGTPSAIQAGLRALARSRYFAGIAENMMIGNLKQVRRYFRESETRVAAQHAVNLAVTEDTRLIIAHSLGSVVAYEALHTYAQERNWRNVKSFISLGSPLGIPNLIFDALCPMPVNGKGSWPPGLSCWTNISDDGDIVALNKQLASLFTGPLIDVEVSNEATAHDVAPYLSDRLTGRSVLDALK